MRRSTLLAVLAAAALGLGTQPAIAQQVSDQQFVQHAAQGGQAEVDLGRLAVQRAARDSVRQFGQRMITDHGAANQELMTPAQQKGITLPAAPDDQQRNIRDRLSALQGPEFDRAYMQEMLVDHQKDVDDFEHEAQSGTDPDVKAWAAKMLPTLREHLQLAREIHTQVVLGPIPTPAPAASVTTVVTAPAYPWCGGAYAPTVGTNFSACPSR